MKFLKNYIYKFRAQIFYKKSGFTLIEALVAISILMIAIASPMMLAQKGLSTATLSKDQMVATFLAQDAIEAVKNIRDQIAMDPIAKDWLNSGTINLEPCICDSKTENCNFDNPTNLKFCTIDTTAGTWSNDFIKKGENISSDDSKVLKIYYKQLIGDEEKHFVKYDYTEGEKSKFTRYINIQKTGELTGNEAVINVRVSWNSTIGEQKIDLQNFIYNYSENII